MFVCIAGSIEHRKNKIQHNAVLVVYKPPESITKMRERKLRTESRE
jgi:UPF0288 family protein (methanogenesis marker protein 3)